MKRCIPIPLLLIALALTTYAPAAENDLIAKLDEELKAVATFEHGADSGPLVRTEQIIYQVATNTKLRRQAELKLINALRSASRRDAKSFLCEQLRTIGTARCIPELEKLLTDPQLSHMARFALGSFEDPEAGPAAAAMHRALHKTSGNLKIGIINTLANLRYKPALPDFIKLLRSSESGMAQASARALGRIGGTEALRALETAQPRASKDLRQQIDNALLLCAEKFLADGQEPQAAKIYQRFYAPNRPKHYRLAGLRGLVAAKGPQAAPLLTEAIEGPDADLQRSAIAFMEKLEGKNVTATFVAMLPSLSSQAQELVLRSLGARGDVAAAPAVSVATKSQHEIVRLAALDALGDLGDASAVPILAYAAATAGANEKKVARASLVRLSGDDVNANLIRSVAAGDPKMRIEMIAALAGRRATQAVSALLKTAADNNDDVRREAIRALGALAGESELPVLVRLAVKPKNEKDRPAIEQAVFGAFKRIKDKTSQAGPVLDALEQAPNDAKPTLIRLLGRPATDQALKAVRAALRQTDADVRDAAIRTLADWPDAGPADDLIAVARTASNQTHKVLALRGYVRMAGLSKDPTAMYVRAMQLAERTDDKKLVLAGLGTADSAQALTLVEGYIKDEKLQTEAALAAVQIAKRLRQSDPTRTRTAMKNIVATVKDARARQQAQDVINEMEQYEGYILVWLAAGPYSVKGKEGAEIFETAFEAEKPGAKVEWKPLAKGIGSWDINLESTFGGKDHVSAYMKTSVVSPADQDVRLELGSDDSVKVWLNGKLIHANNTNRGLSPRQDLVKARLKKGVNDLMLKVIDNSGGWAFGCRVRKPDGSALDGLKFEAK
ncbi:MAG: HEAT repeat domain-containing protein [Phycisphaerae bacterium]|nr:HEAT repeat domain-containing protein [Phycisphaerae bacterium]